MKKYIYISLTAICLSVITGCKNSDDLPMPTSDPNQPIKVTQKMLFRGYSNYAKILCDCEKIGYLATKQNLNEAEISFHLPSAFERDFDITKSADALPTRDIGFVVNGIHAKELAVNSVQPNKQLFGTNVSFSLFNKKAVGNGIMKSPPADDSGGNENGITITMYVPDLLQITSPNVANPEDLMPYCYYKNFVLGWNADPQNENGLVVVVEWNGRDLYGNEYKEYVRNADIIKNDNGKAVLNNKLFDGIPQGAIVQIQLIRGNIEATAIVIDEDGNEEEFTFVAASQAILPFILVREIEQ